MTYQKFSKRQLLALTWWNRPALKEHDGIICDGSIRSGKTVAMTVGFVLWGMSNFEGQNFTLCGKTIESLRRNVTTNLPTWLEGVFTFKERRTENKIVVTANGKSNNFYLFGGRDESSAALIQGITLAGVLLDEVALMPRSFVEQACARCSVEGSKLWFNCNPEGPAHWFYLTWILEASKRNMLRLHFTMEDNLSLSPRVKARYESLYSGVFYDRFIQGLWVVAEGLIYTMFKVEVMHSGGVDCFVRLDDGTLEYDNQAISGSYITTLDPETGSTVAYNWERIPLVCFKNAHHELPLLSGVKCLQDAYNTILSNFVNQMEEDIHSTILVIKNYDGEDLGKLRTNLCTYGFIKVRSYEGAEGGVDTLEVQVNAENYKVLLSLLKDAIIENARGYDAKDDRMGGNPNQMNIQSMYSDIDLDANGIEMEFQASMEELLWFVNKHFANTGKAAFDGVEVKVIFDRDVLINETEAITNCKNSVGILSDETIIKMHPWVSDPEQELKRLKDEREEAAADPYRAAFESNRQTSKDGPIKGGGADGEAE